MTSEDPDITSLLAGWRAGDPDALNRLLTTIRHELRAIARRHLAGEPRDHSMEASSLLNEALLRLLSAGQIDWQSRAHFFRSEERRVGKECRSRRWSRDDNEKTY